jgi:hypothetical protein
VENKVLHPDLKLYDIIVVFPKNILDIDDDTSRYVRFAKANPKQALQLGDTLATRLNELTGSQIMTVRDFVNQDGAHKPEGEVA